MLFVSPEPPQGSLCPGCNPSVGWRRAHRQTVDVSAGGIRALGEWTSGRLRKERARSFCRCNARATHIVVTRCWAQYRFWSIMVLPCQVSNWTENAGLGAVLCGSGGADLGSMRPTPVAKL
jgi:hypothetical protein